MGTSGPRPDRRALGLLGAATALGAALRFHDLGRWSLWFDEAITLLGGLDLGSLATPNDVTQPLWVALVALLRRLADTDAFLRALPALLGVLIIPAAWRLARRLYGPAAGAWAAFLVALAPFHVYYAQELRTYALWGLLALLSWDVLLSALERGGKGRWIALGALNAAALYAHYYALAYWGAQALAALRMGDRAARRGFLLSAAVTALLFAPWAPVFARQIAFLLTVPEGSRTAFSWLPGIGLGTLAGTLANFTEGYHGAGWAPPALVGLAALAGTMLRPGPSLRLWALAGLPAAALYAASLWRMIYSDRYLFPTSLALMLLASAGLGRLRGRAAPAAAAALYAALVAAPLGRLYANDLRTPPERRPAVNARMEFRSAAAALAEGFRPGDWIVHTAENTTLPFDWYLRRVPGAGAHRYLMLDAEDPETGERGPWPHAYRLDRAATPLDAGWEARLPDRTWVVYSEWDWANIAPNEARLARVKRLYGEAEVRKFDGAWLWRLSRPAAASGAEAEVERALAEARWEDALAALGPPSSSESADRAALRGRALEGLGRAEEAREAWRRAREGARSERLRRAAERHLRLLESAEAGLTPPR